MKNYLIGGLLVLVVVFGWLLLQPKTTHLGYAPGWENAYSSGVTHSTVTVGVSKTGTSVASSTQVIATNEERQYLSIQNINSNGYVISCLLGSTATSSTMSGRVLTPLASSTPTSVFELKGDNPYTGAVYCYSQATSTLLTVEK